MDKVSPTTITEVVTINANAAATKIGVAAAGAGVTAWTLNELVAAATFIFVLLQIGLLLPKYYSVYRAWRRGHEIEIEVK